MIAERTHSMLGVLTMLAFLSASLLPCLCATAAAEDIERLEDGDCCPSAADTSHEEEPSDTDHSDCCGNCVTACGEAQDFDASPLDVAVVSTTEVTSSIDAPNLWWTPELVATLWVVDHLVSSSNHASTPMVESFDLRPDRSDTYLQHATFLL